MTKRERHEIAVVVRAIIGDECDEIRSAYNRRFGGGKGIRGYVRKELVAFWTDFEPYLDREYLDTAWMRIGNRIVNYDDAWCFVRDGLKVP